MTDPSVDIRPAPDDDEVAAIVAAIATLSGGTAAGLADEAPRWRWAGRWWSKPIPLARTRPW